MGAEESVPQRNMGGNQAARQRTKGGNQDVFRPGSSGYGAAAARSPWVDNDLDNRNYRSYGNYGGFDDDCRGRDDSVAYFRWYLFFFTLCGKFMAVSVGKISQIRCSVISIMSFVKKLTHNLFLDDFPTNHRQRKGFVFFRPVKRVRTLYSPFLLRTRASTSPIITYKLIDTLKLQLNVSSSLTYQLL